MSQPKREGLCSGSPSLMSPSSTDNSGDSTNVGDDQQSLELEEELVQPIENEASPTSTASSPSPLLGPSSQSAQSGNCSVSSDDNDNDNGSDYDGYASDSDSCFATELVHCAEARSRWARVLAHNGSPTGARKHPEATADGAAAAQGMEFMLLVCASSNGLTTDIHALPLISSAATEALAKPCVPPDTMLITIDDARYGSSLDDMRLADDTATLRDIITGPATRHASINAACIAQDYLQDDMDDAEEPLQQQHDILLRLLVRIVKITAPVVLQDGSSLSYLCIEWDVVEWDVNVL